MQFLKPALILFLAAPAFGADSTLPNQGVVAHEWGTFTSVAGTDGSPVYWEPLSGSASDLPCFVNRLRGGQSKVLLGLVRMETPVIYFYTAGRTALSVHVDFPQGVITEWYPRAAKVTPETAPAPGQTGGQIDWNIEVTPGEHPVLPVSQGPSHYFAARDTDAAPVRAFGQQEKMIFYRGLGTFSVPLRPVYGGDGKLEIRNAGAEPIAAAVLFENRGGRIGYRIVRDLRGSVKLDTPELTGDVERLKQELADALVETGLYRKEALAMIATWRDSWFEEGTRVFYAVPQAAVDAILPLKITPAPEAIARSFVGRVEVLSPATEQALTSALKSGDLPVLNQYGRFLQPFLALMPQTAQADNVAAFLHRKYAEVQRDYDSPACVQ